MDGYKWHHFSFGFPLLFSVYITHLDCNGNLLIPLEHLLCPAAVKTYCYFCSVLHNSIKSLSSGLLFQVQSIQNHAEAVNFLAEIVTFFQN